MNSFVCISELYADIFYIARSSQTIAMNKLRRMIASTAPFITCFICIFFILLKPDGTYHDNPPAGGALWVVMKILSWTFHVFFTVKKSMRQAGSNGIIHQLINEMDEMCCMQ